MPIHLSILAHRVEVRVSVREEHVEDYMYL